MNQKNTEKFRDQDIDESICSRIVSFCIILGLIVMAFKY